jgi:aminocarboxymuconate-semialdehyde decarboxylase
MAKKIDVHTHLYPRSYLEVLVKHCQSPKFIKVGDNKYRMQEGDTIMGHIDGVEEIDPEVRAQAIPKLGLDAQVISTPLPGAERLEKSISVETQELINNELAATCKKYPKVMPRFLCSVSWKDVDASLKEMKRAKGMGAVGILCPSNVHGRAISDPEFEPIFKQGAELGMPFLVHPSVPLTAEAQNINGLPWQLFGFTFDTTMATIGCVYKGYLEKYPKLTLMVCHTGGTIPFLAFRIANSYKKYAETYKGAKDWFKMDKPLTEYLKKIMFDNCQYWGPSFRCAYELVGAEGLFLGTDYPHRAGGDWGAAGFIDAQSWLNEKEKEMIMGGNVMRVMNFKI